MKLDQIKECVDYFKDKIGITLVVVTGILFCGMVYFYGSRRVVWRRK